MIMIIMSANVQLFITVINSNFIRWRNPGPKPLPFIVNVRTFVLRSYTWHVRLYVAVVAPRVHFIFFHTKLSTYSVSERGFNYANATWWLLHWENPKVKTRLFFTCFDTRGESQGNCYFQNYVEHLTSSIKVVIKVRSLVGNIVLNIATFSFLFITFW